MQNKANIKPGYYILDYRKLAECKALNAHFLSVKAAELFIARNLPSKVGFMVVSSEELLTLNAKFKRIKRRFYSKYEVEDWRLLNKQAKKTLRTVLRRRLFGYCRSSKFSVYCDACGNSRPHDPKFAKLAPFIIRGRIARACKQCTHKYYGLYKQRGELILIPKFNHLTGREKMAELKKQGFQIRRPSRGKSILRN